MRRPRFVFRRIIARMTTDKPEHDDAKTRIELAKHFTTLSTGTIVLAATLFDKFSHPFLGRQLFVWSFVCLINSLTGGVALLMAPERITRRRNVLLYRWVGISFVLGILLLYYFAYTNLKAR